MLARMSMAAVLSVACASVGRAATYYVDFEAGKDVNGGQTPDAALQHCPGDKMAAGNAKGLNLAPGDTVIFKGGVSYRGTIAFTASGVEGKAIVYDGNTAGRFGKGRAIIDGSELITGWKQCASAEECGGNSNWKTLFYAYLPGAIDGMGANLYEGDKMGWNAQEPNLKDPFYLDDLSTFRKAGAKDVTVTSVTDAANLTQTDPHAWDGATVLFWGTPNLVYQRKVTGFDPATHRLSFEKVPGVYTNRDSLYAIANHLRVLDKPGESVVMEKDSQGRRKIFYWPQTEGDIEQKSITYSARALGVDVAGRSYVTLQGFVIQKPGGEKAVAINTLGGKATGVKILNNEVRWCRSSERSNAVSVPGLEHSLVDGNNVHENVRSRGLAFNDGVDLVVSNNVLRKNGGTGIAFFGCAQSKMIGNTVTEHNGVHANALTVYSKSSDVLVFGNRVFDSNIALTTQASTNITVAYNILTGAEGYMFADWNNCDGLKIYNNVILADKGECALTVGMDTKNVVFKNNICGGQGLDRMKNGAADMSNNIYTVRSSSQRKKELEKGSMEIGDLSAIFVDPAKRDYRLKAGSKAIDAGVDVGMTKEIVGTKVPQGSGVDIGAFETQP